MSWYVNIQRSIAICSLLSLCVSSSKLYKWCVSTGVNLETVYKHRWSIRNPLIIDLPPPWHQRVMCIGVDVIDLLWVLNHSRSHLNSWVTCRSHQPPFDTGKITKQLTEPWQDSWKYILSCFLLSYFSCLFPGIWCNQSTIFNLSAHEDRSHVYKCVLYLKEQSEYA